MALSTDKMALHIEELKECRLCAGMTGPVVTGLPVVSDVILIGQAPGNKEGPRGRPFAWTAGRTLFKWFARLGPDEETFRNRVYFAAVCRCFPGKKPKGGDRVPALDEIENCSRWMRTEFELLDPRLVIPVGKLAMSLFLEPRPLIETIGAIFRITRFGKEFDVIPLPHPSGASPWHRMEPGKTLLEKALDAIGRHRAFRAAFRDARIIP